MCCLCWIGACTCIVCRQLNNCNNNPAKWICLSNRDTYSNPVILNWYLNEKIIKNIWKNSCLHQLNNSSMLVNLYSFYYVFVAYLELVLVLLCTCKNSYYHCQCLYEAFYVVNFSSYNCCVITIIFNSSWYYYLASKLPSSLGAKL